jgi:DNA modification methylase
MSSKQWQNRIVGYDNVPPDQLLANPANFRLHPKRQQDALTGSLNELGWLQDIIVNRVTQHVLDGHLRVQLALRNGEATVPVKYIELSEPEEKLALAVFDPITYMAETDTAILDALLREVNTGEEALQELLASMAEDAGLHQDKKDIDAAPQVDRAEELRQQWGVESGQLWQLGEHRLICGDCTDAAVVARLMGGEKAGTVITDPPYGINREGIPNDDPGGLRELFDGSLAVMPIVDAVVIAFQSPRLFPVWLDAIRANGQKFERMLWMYKPNDVTFTWRGWITKSEAILVSSIGKPEWQEPDPYAHDCYTSNWDKDSKVDIEGWHASIKPPKVIAELIGHTTGVVYEPFSGSGTTILACEQLGRKCRACEISPGYVAVALQRYFDSTGQTPVLLTD